jgi:hypothetical protein
MKRREGEPWMPAPQYGASLRGLTVNLLVAEIERAHPFHVRVLRATCVYRDQDIAVYRHGDAQWMLHADHTYDGHPLHATLGLGLHRGVGAELRLHGCDPDAAQAAARRLGFDVVASAADKPHGLREAYLMDADGYLWVPDVPLRSP